MWRCYQHAFESTETRDGFREGENLTMPSSHYLLVGLLISVAAAVCGIDPEAIVDVYAALVCVCVRFRGRLTFFFIAHLFICLMLQVAAKLRLGVVTMSYNGC